MLTIDRFTDDKIRFGIADIASLDKNAWKANADSKSWACNTATPLKDGTTFPSEWKKHFGFPLTGALGRTDYAPTAGGSITRRVKGGAKLAAFTVLDICTLGIFGAIAGGECFEMLEETFPVPPAPPILSEGSKWSDE